MVCVKPRPTLESRRHSLLHAVFFSTSRASFLERTERMEACTHREVARPPTFSKPRLALCQSVRRSAHYPDVRSMKENACVILWLVCSPGLLACHRCSA